MIAKVNRIIKLLNQLAKSIEYRVIKPSKKPADMVKGKVLRKILRLFLKPILKEFILE